MAEDGGIKDDENLEKQDSVESDPALFSQQSTDSIA